VKSECEAYLDIETTGLSPYANELTVVGIYSCAGDKGKLTQLIGENITSGGIVKALRGATTIYTYNGTKFDLPFIAYHLGVDLARLFHHHDLLHDCWQNSLFGGLKCVEQRLCIPRKLVEMNGRDAVRLWWRYVDSFDLDALRTLLEYNKEDVVNLRILKERLFSYIP